MAAEISGPISVSSADGIPDLHASGRLDEQLEEAVVAERSTKIASGAAVLARVVEDRVRRAAAAPSRSASAKMSRRTCRRARA